MTAMGPRSDERGNSRCRNLLIVKELQPTRRAIPSLAGTVLSVNPDNMTTRRLDPSSKSVKDWRRSQARRLKREEMAKKPKAQ